MSESIATTPNEVVSSRENMPVPDRPEDLIEHEW